MILAWCALACATSPVPAAAPPPPAATPMPYGYWGLNGFLTPAALPAVRDRLRVGVVQTATTDPVYAVSTLFPMAKAAGVRVSLRLVGDHPRYTHDGDFDLAAWTTQLERWEPAVLAPWIADGTLVGHMLLDDIANFEGHDPTAAELDEMARRSKARFPGLMTFVRERATAMPEPAGGRYLHVDAVVNQYKALDGDVEAFAAETAARAAQLDLGVINGLNIANGGDGSSGQAGWAEGRWAMSAAEIRRNGRVMAAVPSCGMFLNWEYDGVERWADGSVGAAWFDRAELTAALAELGAVVASHPAVELRRGSRKPSP